MKYKKMLGIVTSSIMILSSQVISYANTTNTYLNDDAIYINQNQDLIGVSYNEPLEYSSRSTAIPSNYWDLKTQGTYNFSGYATGSSLYTNYYFKNKTSYTVYVENSGSTALKVQLKDRFKTYGTITVPANGSTTQTISGVSSNAGVYLKFYAPSNFTGYIK